ncbi:MAG: C2H2-type zinc finger protein [Thermofilaceae archaeon]
MIVPAACPFCGGEVSSRPARTRRGSRFFCEHCGRTFYACSACGEVFATPQALASHTRTHRSEAVGRGAEPGELRTRLEALEKRVAELEGRLGALAALERRLEALEERVRALEGRAGGRQAGLDWLAGNPWLQLISTREAVAQGEVSEREAAGEAPRPAA